jgi:glycosyltransferase involved in cell wall biosynthesis
MKVLQICHKMPFPPVDGGAQAIYYTTIGLILNNVTLKTLAINTPKCWVDDSKIPDDFNHSCNFESIRVDTRIKVVKVFINLFKKDSYIIERFVSEVFKNKLIQILNTESFDIIQLEYLFLCKYIDILRKHTNALILLRPQNVEYIIWERYLTGLRNPIKKTFLNIAIRRLKKFEHSVKNKLDGIIAITEQDKNIFQSFDAKRTPVVAIPMGYKSPALEISEKSSSSGQLNIYHLASMDWLPNQEAVAWFLDNIYPYLRGKLGGNKIFIAGRNMQHKFYKYSNEEVIIQGAVDTPVEYQSDKSIMIVPLISGSGIRAKIIEGLALGKTIISTSIGAQGIKYENNINIIIADKPESFANSILRVINDVDLCKTMGKNASKLFKEEYEYKMIANRMISFYTYLLNEKGE